MKPYILALDGADFERSPLARRCHYLLKMPDCYRDCFYTFAAYQVFLEVFWDEVDSQYFNVHIYVLQENFVR